MRNDTSINYRQEEVLDSRTLDRRIQYLLDAKESVDEENKTRAFDNQARLEVHEERELKNLIDVKDEINEWCHGVELIHEGHWVEYVEQMLRDNGDLPRDIPHYIEIDWESTASNVEADYCTVDIMGETFYYRSC